MFEAQQGGGGIGHEEEQDREGRNSQPFRAAAHKVDPSMFIVNKVDRLVLQDLQSLSKCSKMLFH